LRSRPGLLGLLLAPGAGADRNQVALVAIDEAVTSAGGVVVRMDFPYRRAGRRSPDRPPVLLAAAREEADSLARRCDHLVMGGRSMGGRICSMAAAEGVEVAGLVLISYPLHPPGRPDKLRVEHFPELECPCLFVSGTRDAFGSPAELEAAAAAIPGPVTHRWIDGKDHGLRGCDATVSAFVLDWLSSLGLLRVPSRKKP
jgi:predicted alpha/beta-hydrolase family hydrolase